MIPLLGTSAALLRSVSASSRLVELEKPASVDLGGAFLPWESSSDDPMVGLFGFESIASLFISSIESVVVLAFLSKDHG